MISKNMTDSKKIMMQFKKITLDKNRPYKHAILNKRNYNNLFRSWNKKYQKFKIRNFKFKFHRVSLKNLFNSWMPSWNLRLRDLNNPMTRKKKDYKRNWTIKYSKNKRKSTKSKKTCKKLSFKKIKLKNKA